MSFIKTYEPKCFNDLVFSDPANEKTLHQYAQGIQSNHLVLHGPYGTGKSTTARIIGLERMLKQGGTAFKAIYNGRTDPPRKDWKGVIQNPYYTKLFADPELVVLDEVDCYPKKLLAMLVPELKRTSDTFVMTTNNLQDLDPSLIALCNIVHLTQPKGVQFTDRALAILRAEGFSFNRNDVYEAMHTFTGNFRDLEKFLQNFSIKNKPMHPKPPTILTVQINKSKQLPTSK